MTVVLTHAYSPDNAGDGLLVELTVERLERVGIPRGEMVLVALDPTSFEGFGRTIGVGTTGRSLSVATMGAAARAAIAATDATAGWRRTALARAMDEADAVVGVGGGYLRAADAVSAVGTSVNHLPQLMAASRGGVPSMMMPQSIGPLRGPVGRRVRRELAGVGTVCVRDPVSARELAGSGNVREIPDLVVLDIADNWSRPPAAPVDSRIAFAARRVDHAPGFMGPMRRVADTYGDRVTWAAQALGDASKSDAAFLEGAGIAEVHSLPALLDEGDLACVVSVRLHGALCAIRAGIPAVHLAYDRKGPAAYAALGLDPWCIDVRGLDERTLAAAVEGIVSDPSAYWDRVAAEVPALRSASSELDSLVGALFGSGGDEPARDVPDGGEEPGDRRG